MCGRFSLYYSKDFISRYQLQKPPQGVKSRYNIAPGQDSLVVVRQSPNQAVNMKWGLVPFWAKDPNIGYRMINARAETLAEKPSFRRPLARQRCLVPASGFYEWKKIDEKTKIPYYARFKGKDYFSMAGLYDVWHDMEKKELKTFTVITVEPNKLISPIHDRMPAILSREDESIWLDTELTDPATVLGLLKPHEETGMEVYPVSKAVNSPANDGLELIEKAGEQQSLL